MITENTKKLRPKTKSKILVAGIILSVIIGLFAPVFQARVYACTGTDTTDANGNCVPATPAQSQGYCTNPNADSRPVLYNNQKDCQDAGMDWSTVVDNKVVKAQTPPDPNANALQNHLEQCLSLTNGSLAGCFENVVYFIFMAIPSFLMANAAKMFDFFAALTLSSHMYGLTFIQNIWGIVRDFANIFFILILLYAAFEIILDLGHGSAKKIVASVILIALVVNFSLFFTKIVIDSSNIVALIFYNRVDTSNIAPDNISDPVKLGLKEKSMSAALVSRFNPDSFFTPEFLDSLQTTETTSGGFTGAAEGAFVGGTTSAVFGGVTAVPGAIVGGIMGFVIPHTTTKIPVTLIVSMMVVYGLVIYALTYAFFIVALSFLGRMLNLMMLMIVSPFAFVTAAVPKFKGINTIGFDSWLKKLLESSFVAAVFMFILYIISEILKAKIFDDIANTTKSPEILSKMIMLFTPAILIVVFLLKGAKYAKSASGEFTEHIIKYTEIATGAVVGGGLGVAGAIGQGTLGHLGKMAFDSKTLAGMETSRRAGLGGKLERFAGSRLRTIAGGDDGKGGVAGSSFDARKGIIGAGLKAVTAVSGLDLAGIKLGGVAKMLTKDGGYVADLEKRDKKRKVRAEGLAAKEGEPEKQALNKLQDDHQGLLTTPDANGHTAEDRITDIKKKMDIISEEKSRLQQRANIIDIVDPVKVAEKNAALDAARTGVFADAAGRTAAIAAANAINVNDPAKVAAKAAANAAAKKKDDELNELKVTRSNIKGGREFTVDPTTGAHVYNTHNNNITSGEVSSAVEDAATAVAAKAAADVAVLAHPGNAALVTAAAAAAATATTKLAEAAAAAAEVTRAAAANPTHVELNAAAVAANAAVAQISTANAAPVTAPIAINTTLVGTTKTSAKAAADAENGLGRSINDFEDEYIPQGEHAVSNVSKGRVRRLATNMENSFAWPWNKAARAKSAHEMRMGVKADSKASGSGGH